MDSELTDEERELIKWTDEELVDGLLEANIWNDVDAFAKLKTAWLVEQLQLRGINERIEQARIDGMAIRFVSGELVAMERE